MIEDHAGRRTGFSISDLRMMIAPVGGQAYEFPTPTLWVMPVGGGVISLIFSYS